ncbi:MAG: hypothetical protein JKY67_22345 [Pseudomonadales bacterium]|nr:hypothetical protein [Pseudomonadales bacterium]
MHSNAVALPCQIELVPIAETGLKERFTDHDIRAKVASDAEANHARQLMGHADQKITDKIYRRKAERVVPFKSK